MDDLIHMASFGSVSKVVLAATIATATVLVMRMRLVLLVCFSPIGVGISFAAETLDYRLVLEACSNWKEFGYQDFTQCESTKKLRWLLAS